MPRPCSIAAAATGRAGRKGISVLLVPRAKLRRAEGMLVAAGVQPTWSGPPTVEEIRALDQQRLLQDPLLTEPANEEDAGLAAALAGERSAEDLAAALIRLYRSHLPALEDVSDPGFRADPRPAKAERGERAPPREGGHEGGGAEGVWFRLDVGRANNADPRRLLPMLCRRGDINRQDIGAIRIFDRETKVEIHPGRADHFAEAIRRSAGVGAVGIERLGAAPARERAPRTSERAPRADGPRKAEKKQRARS